MEDKSDKQFHLIKKESCNGSMEKWVRELKEGASKTQQCEVKNFLKKCQWKSLSNSIFQI